MEITFVDRYAKKPVKQFNLNIKLIFSNKITLFLLIAFPFLAQILSIIFIPFKFSGTFRFLCSVCLPVLLILGQVSFQWKRSTLMSNDSLCNSNRFSYNLSLILTIIVIGNILSLFMVFLDFSTLNLGIQLDKWIFQGGGKIHNGDFNMHNINFISFFYVVQVDLAVMFSIYFLFSRFFNDVRAYYIFVLIIAILSIIFGGIFSNPFGVRLVDGEIRVAALKGMSMFPIEMYPFSLALPFFAPATLFQIAYNLPISDIHMWGNSDLFTQQIHQNPFWFYNISHFGDVKGSCEKTFQMSLAFYIDPFATIAVYGLIGITESHFRKRNTN